MNSTEALNILDAEEKERYLQLAKLIAERPSQFLFELIPFKEELTRRMPIPEAFQVFRCLLQLSSDAAIERLSVKSLFDVTSRHAAVFHETAPSGIAFTAQPPRVVGRGDQRPLQCVTRSLYCACLTDACVSGRSAFITYADAALLDFQAQELDRVDEHLILDLPVLQASKEAVWIATSRNPALTLDEAFDLLGPNTPQFGHWIWEYMPKYVAAAMSAQIWNVPVLIDAHMPRSHKEFLQMVLPAGAQIVEVPYNATVRVRRLWCAPTLSYLPLYIRTIDPLWPNYAVHPPERFAAVFREIGRRVGPVLLTKAAPERIFLARKPHQLKKLVNHTAIEQYAERQGFQLVYPQDIDFAEQLMLVRGARYIIGPEGSALFLCFLASPGTKLCILSSPNIFNSTASTCLLEELGIDTTILTGAVVKEHEAYAHFADYSIPEDRFRSFLKEWLE